MTRQRVKSCSMAARVTGRSLTMVSILTIFIQRIMCEALDDHKGSVSIEDGLLPTNFRFADYIIVNAEVEEAVVLLDRLDTITTMYKLENGADKTSYDKQSKWLPQKDQDKRSETRSSGELQVPGISHL